MASELTAAQIEQINSFTNTTVIDNEEWDAIIQRMTGLVDTPQGRNFVHAALQALTIEVQEGDLHQNVEMLLFNCWTHQNSSHHRI